MTSFKRGKNPDLNWGMLGNDQVGDCLVASSAHEVMAEASISGRAPVFDTKHVLQSYSVWTGYVLGDEKHGPGHRSNHLRQESSEGRCPGLEESGPPYRCLRIC